MMAKTPFLFLCLAVCGSACNVLPEDPQQAAFTLIPGSHFYPPCGEPRLSARMPQQDGYFLVYVLTDSLQMKNCVSPPLEDSLQVNFETDFLVAAVVRDAKPEWRFQLKNMKVTDSMLHIHLVPYHYTDKDFAQPEAPLSATCVWKVNGAAVKLIKLYTAPENYAYVHGPAWNEAPVLWKHLPDVEEQ
jgi:hypothetical protein